MRVENITNNNYSKTGYRSNFATAALISAMMTTPSANAKELKADTFEITPKTEYVQQYKDYSAESTYQIPDSLAKRARGEEFNNWFMNILSATDDDGRIDREKLNGTPVNFALKDGESLSDLARAVISTFDRNNDGEISYGEYERKSLANIDSSNKNMPENYKKTIYRKNLDNVFFGFDINDRFYKKFKGENTYDKGEVAASLYAVSGVSYDGQKARTVIKGDNLMKELNMVLEKGYPNSDFIHNQRDIYEYFENNEN